ncbi:Bug family tripartite tricarboxylate transporter substrate binding protein [Bordetella muralis]|uniref:Bug family tripartite tricarboxylate transporter substrate binding protein n=1 Tax=Bordetella muralis TaxID=1649130 RepID=UPI0039EF375F
MFQRVSTFAAAVALSACAGLAHAAYPEQPITVISPFPAGGATDVLTRILASRMSTALDQKIIVENKAGAGTTIGASYVARAQPDGYTLLMATNSTLVTNRYLYKSLPYDPDAYAPIGMVGIGPMILLSNKKNNIAKISDIVAQAKQRPAQLTFASFGPGTSSHLAGELFRQEAGVDLLHVPFKGATQALPALINGDVDVFFDMVATGMPQVTAGKLNVLGITSKNRLSTLPDVPTLAEQGYPSFDLSAWFSFVAPPGTPSDVLTTLQQALTTTLQDPVVREKMLGMGIEPRSGTAAELTEQIRDEQPIVKKLVNQANLTPQ